MCTRTWHCWDRLGFFLLLHLAFIFPEHIHQKAAYWATSGAPYLPPLPQLELCTVPCQRTRVGALTPSLKINVAFSFQITTTQSEAEGCFIFPLVRVKWMDGGDDCESGACCDGWDIDLDNKATLLICWLIFVHLLVTSFARRLKEWTDTGDQSRIFPTGDDDLTLPIRKVQWKELSRGGGGGSVFALESKLMPTLSWQIYIPCILSCRKRNERPVFCSWHLSPRPLPSPTWIISSWLATNAHSTHRNDCNEPQSVFRSQRGRSSLCPFMRLPPPPPSPCPLYPLLYPQYSGSLHRGAPPTSGWTESRRCLCFLGALTL